MMTNTKISKWFEVRMENKLSVGPNIHLPVSTLVIPKKKKWKFNTGQLFNHFAQFSSVLAWFSINFISFTKVA